MADRPAVDVRCQPTGSGWRCTVVVGEDPGATTHQVSVAAADLPSLAPGGATVEGLVGASFAFLLEREPRESILRAFELPVIGRFFPEYEREIRHRLGG